MSSEKLKKLADKYGAKLRSESQIVHHSTYGFSTQVGPVGFQLFEIAAKAQYISNFLGMKKAGMDVSQHIAYYSQRIFGPYGIETPAIRSTDTIKGAAQDYHEAAKALSQMKGVDTQTGEQRDLYFACLD